MQVISISPHVTPIWTVFQCGRNWKANTVYRRVAVGSTISTGRASTATTPGTSPATTPATPPSGTAIPLPTGTETGSTELPAPAPASSQAWIAGAVIGPVVGCALVGLLVWWITRHRMKKASAATAAGSAGWTGGPYHQNQPLAPWPAASPSPSHGQNAQYQGWDAQNKTNSMASGGTVGYPQELSSNPGSNTGHHGQVYEMHQTQH
ncbi:hypothetical protein PG985_008499 [Apiospora marii]|uniref:uncharacterized protein n=1 Tax=Apiospora marii TaxID=335849 RepID=UPI00312FCC7F